MYYEQKWNFLHVSAIFSCIFFTSKNYFPKKCLLAKCTCFQDRKCFHWPLQWLLLSMFSVRGLASECKGLLCFPSLAAGAPLITVMSRWRGFFPSASASQTGRCSCCASPMSTRTWSATSARRGTGSSSTSLSSCALPPCRRWPPGLAASSPCKAFTSLELKLLKCLTQGMFHLLPLSPLWQFHVPRTGGFSEL